MTKLTSTDARLFAALIPLASTLTSFKNYYDANHLPTADQTNLFNNNNFVISMTAGVGTSLMVLVQLADYLNSSNALSQMSPKQKAAIFVLVALGLLSAVTPFYLFSNVSNNPSIGLPWTVSTTFFAAAHVGAKRIEERARVSTGLTFHVV